MEGVKESTGRAKVFVIQGWTTSVDINAQERTLAHFFSYCFKVFFFPSVDLAEEKGTAFPFGLSKQL